MKWDNPVLAVRWPVFSWVFFSLSHLSSHFPFLALRFLQSQERVGLDNVCVSFELWHLPVWFQHFRWFFYIFHLNVFVTEDFACDLICSSKCLLGISTWMLPEGSLTSVCEGRFSPSLSSHAPYILPLLTFLRMTQPFLLVPAQSFRCTGCPDVRCLSTSLFSISPLSSLSSHLCSGSSLLSFYILMHMQILIL